MTSTAIIPSGVSSLARTINVDPRELVDALKTQIMPNAKDAELMAFCMVATKYGLDPFMKQIYAVRKNGNGAYEAWIAVDGWYAIVERHPQNDGVEFEEHRTEDGTLRSITCRMYRKDRSRPVVVTEWLDECRRDTKPWRENPSRMLRHRAFVQAARIAYAIAEPGGAEDAPDVAPPASGVVPVDPVRDLNARLGLPEAAPEIEAEVVDAAESFDDIVAELVDLNLEAGVETTAERITTKIVADARKAKRDPIDIARERRERAREAIASNNEGDQS